MGVAATLPELSEWTLKEFFSNSENLVSLENLF